MKIELIAQACHENNRVFCLMLGDESQLPWDQAPQAIRESAIKGVEFYLQHRCTPQEQHAEWRRHKEAQGYVYGEVKDDKAKTHPCIVDYDQLPSAQRIKDVIFQSTINTFLSVTGMN